MTAQIQLELPVSARHFVSLYSVILILSICSVTVAARNARFPFLLSNGTCALPSQYTSMCTCTTRLAIMDYDNFCGSYLEMTECLDTEISKNSSSLVGRVFNKTETLKKLQYLCNLYTDIKPELDSCPYEKEAQHCDKIANWLYMRNTTLGKAEVCGFTEVYSNCYWNITCPIRVKHFLSSTVAFYSSYTCAEHGTAINAKCSNLGKAMFPEMKKLHEHCIGFVNETKECFIRENLLLSTHPDDVIHNTGFDIERFVEYRVFRCNIEKERNHECSSKKRKEQRSCFLKFKSDMKHEESRVRNGSRVPVKDLCRIYDDVTQCMVTLFSDCPVESVYFNSILCASMPSSCHCPVNLHHEVLARSSEAPIATIPAILVLIYSVSLLTINHILGIWH